MRKYFLHDGEKELGVYTFEEISILELHARYHVWYDSLAEWQPIETIEELKPFIKYPSPVVETIVEAAIEPEIIKPEAATGVEVANNTTLEEVAEQHNFKNQDYNNFDNKIKLYPGWSFLLSTIFLPNILSGYYFAYHNYKILGEKKKAENIIVAGILLTIVQFIAVFMSAPFKEDQLDSWLHNFGYANFSFTIFVNMYLLFNTNKFIKSNYGIDLNRKENKLHFVSAGKVIMVSALFFTLFIISIAFTALSIQH